MVASRRPPRRLPLSDFPQLPLDPNDFFEGFLADALAQVKLPRRVKGPIGVVLRGRDGGEWSVHLRPDAPRVEAGLDDDVALTWVQSVEDWRGALWEGRGGEGGRWAQLAFDPGRLAAQAGRRPRSKTSSKLFERLLRAAGLFELCITGAPGGDWAAAVQLGAGPIERRPDARVTLNDDDAVALTSGALSPMEALLTGRARFDGDAGLLRKLPVLARAGAVF